MSKYNKIITFCIATALVLATLMIPISADAQSVDYSPGELIGAQNAILTKESLYYDNEYTRQVVDACRSFAYLQCQRGSSFAFAKTSNTGSYQMFNPAVLVPLFVTGSNIPNTRNQCSYYVYFAVISFGNTTGLTIDQLPEEWGQAGATIRVRSVSNQSIMKGLIVYTPFRNGSTGQVVFCPGESGATYQISGSYVDINFKNSDTYKETIIYTDIGVGSGYNEYYTYGYINPSNYNLARGYADWKNAYTGYTDGVGSGGVGSGGGFTQDDLDNAYDDGYMDGEQSGYHQGAQDGYANGYADGYDQGYSSSAGAEEIESAYEDGKADGLVEGYQNGKADGLAEGYANGYDKGYDNGVETGYDKGYDNGVETGYEDGKADGLVEGYQNGKADGVAEGYANGYDKGYDNGYETGYDKGYDNGVETGYEDGKADGLVEGYQNGKADGVAEGYANGYDKGYDNGYETGYDEGYDYGYNLGESVGSTEIDIGEIISAVPEGAKSIINGALGFEIFGINVAGTLTALLVVAIVAFVVKKLMTR